MSDTSKNGKQISDLSKKELKALASQLGKPEGDKGLEIAQMMNTSNISMTRKTLEQLSIQDNDHVLELGHGNANHLTEIFSIAKHIQYSGLEISKLMKQEAEKFSSEHHFDKKSSFGLYDGTNIPFTDDSFEKIFTVNTLYFWKEPEKLLNELQRVLKPSGRLCISFVDEETMNRLPFTDYGFTKYNQKTFQKLIEKSDLKTAVENQYTDIAKSKSGEEIARKYWMMTLTKSID